MRSRDATLLDEIEDGATDGRASIADTLRKCVVLGGRSGSQELQDWATAELKGFFGKDDLPEYRVIKAQLTIDGATTSGTVTGQPIPRSMLPEFARDEISDEFHLRQGAGEIEELVKRAESTDDAVKFSLPMGADLAQLMGGQGQVVLAVYWSIAPAALRGVLDQVRTALAQLVAELRATMTDKDSLPSADEATQAIHFVVTGNRNTVNLAQASSSGAGSPVQATSSASGERQSLVIKIVSILAAIATIVGTVLVAINL